MPKKLVSFGFFEKLNLTFKIKIKFLKNIKFFKKNKIFFIFF